MKTNSENLRALLSLTWHRLTLRDQQALKVLGLVLVAVLALIGMWQPAQLRLAAAEHMYQQQQRVAAEISQIQAPSGRSHDARPLSVQLNERALADGLDLQQLEVQDRTLRLTIGGEARALLAWIHQTELAGATLQSLTLDKRGQHLEAQLVVQASSAP